MNLEFNYGEGDTSWWGEADLIQLVLSEHPVKTTEILEKQEAEHSSFFILIWRNI